MDQLQSPFDKQIPSKFLTNIFSDIRNVDAVLSEWEVKQMNLFDCFTFGSWFSSVLFEKNRIDDYHRFITKFNDFIKKEFKSSLDFIHEIYSSLGIKSGNVFSVLNEPKFHIEDVTDIFRGEEFKTERDMERILANGFRSWASDIWNVQRQLQIGFGKCDISIVSNEEKVAIELKKSFAQRKDVFQASEYSRNNSGYASVLIAKGFDKEVIQIANDLNVVCYEYCLGRPVGETVPEIVVLYRMNEPRKLTNIELEIEEMNECDGILIDYTDVPKPNDAFKTSSEILSNLRTASLKLLELYKRG